MIKPKNLTEIEKAEILQSMKILGGNYLLEEVEKLRAYFLYVDIVMEQVIKRELSHRKRY